MVADHWFPWIRNELEKAGFMVVAKNFPDSQLAREKYWLAIKNNQRWIIQFASTDDPYIPIEQPRYIHEKLNTEYYEHTDQGHFGGDEKHVKATFPELLQALLPKIQ